MRGKILFLVLLLTIATVSAPCIERMVVGKVSLYQPGLTVKLYCDGSYLFETPVTNPKGLFMTEVCCDDTLTGELYLDGVLLEVQEANERNDVFLFEFCGVNQIPEFTTIGAAIALAGAGLFYKFRRKN